MCNKALVKNRYEISEVNKEIISKDRLANMINIKSLNLENKHKLD